MRLRLDTEDWREQVVGWVVDPSDKLDDYQVDMLADQLSQDVVRALQHKGLEVERAYQQSRGWGVIFQGGTKEEESAFDSVLAEALFEQAEQVRASLTEEDAE